MKTPEEWVAEYEKDRCLPRYRRRLIHTNGQYVSAIQLDAKQSGIIEGLEIAAKLAEEYDGKGLSGRSYYNQLGDGCRTKNDIATAIHAELTKLKKELR